MKCYPGKITYGDWQIRSDIQDQRETTNFFMDLIKYLNITSLTSQKKKFVALIRKISYFDLSPEALRNSGLIELSKKLSKNSLNQDVTLCLTSKEKIDPQTMQSYVQNADPKDPFTLVSVNKIAKVRVKNVVQKAMKNLCDIDPLLDSIIRKLIAQEILEAFSDIITQKHGARISIVELAEGLETLIGDVIAKFPNRYSTKDLLSLFELYTYKPSSKKIIRKKKKPSAGIGHIKRITKESKSFYTTLLERFDFSDCATFADALRKYPETSSTQLRKIIYLKGAQIPEQKSDSVKEQSRIQQRTTSEVSIEREITRTPQMQSLPTKPSRQFLKKSRKNHQTPPTNQQLQFQNFMNLLNDLRRKDAISAEELREYRKTWFEYPERRATLISRVKNLRKE
jgi:hypothetical protein